MTEQVNVYLAIKFHQNHSNRPHVDYVLSVIAHAGCHGCCIVYDNESSIRHPGWAVDLMTRAFSVINSSQIILIDASEKGVGIGIEAGYAFARGIPIITIAEEGATISDTLSGISSVTGIYSDPGSLLDLLPKLIEEVLAATKLHAHNS